MICGALGYLTPKIIDECSSGQPRGAGRAYTLNILGCILGPLFASYLLLPRLGLKGSIMAVTVLFLVDHGRGVLKGRGAATTGLLGCLVLCGAGFFSATYEEVYESEPGAVVLRDHMATVVSLGTGMGKMALVNGIGITHLTPVTEAMAHLPLAFQEGRPESGLVICLGMGTTYRSLLSWGIRATAVELVPSVKDAMPYCFRDADRILGNPRGKIVIDDGRRFLERTTQTFDAVTIDPPPPIETAGSSLLYSEEFYTLIGAHLTEKGILQQWFPGGKLRVLQATARSLVRGFSHVRVFKSIERQGFHFIASKGPITPPSVEAMIERMPPEARPDRMEWFGNEELRTVVAGILQREVPLGRILNADESILRSCDAIAFPQRSPGFRNQPSTLTMNCPSGVPVS